jgi:hypothetical protein
MIALIMTAVSTSETSVNMYQVTRRDIPENSHLQDLIVRISETSSCNTFCLPESSVYVAVYVSSLQLCGCDEMAEWLFP